MKRNTAKVWAKRVERWRASGLSGTEFARRIGVNARTLAWWRWHLASAGGSGPSVPTGSLPAEFVELVPAASVGFRTAGGGVQREAPSGDSAHTLELELPGGVRIRLTRAFDVASVAALVRALERG